MKTKFLSFVFGLVLALSSVFVQAASLTDYYSFANNKLQTNYASLLSTSSRWISSCTC